MSGIVNDASTPAEYPNNEWTQMIEAIRRRNEQGAPMPPERGVPTVGTPMPTARSADLGRPVQPAPSNVPPPLTAAEIEALNHEALRSGLVVGPVNPSIARTLDNAGGSDDAQYGSLEEAIAAGAPVGADDEAIIEGALRFREPMPSSPTIPVRAPIGGRRMTAREYIDSQQTPSSLLPRLPDFKKVQMIDMVNGKVYVDGLMFAMEPGELKMLRKFCVTKAKEQIQASLDAALKELAEDTDGGAQTL